jgi:hypothetical protein
VSSGFGVLVGGNVGAGVDVAAGAGVDDEVGTGVGDEVGTVVSVVCGTGVSVERGGVTVKVGGTGVFVAAGAVLESITMARAVRAAVASPLTGVAVAAGRGTVGVAGTTTVAVAGTRVAVGTAGWVEVGTAGWVEVGSLVAVAATDRMVAMRVTPGVGTCPLCATTPGVAVGRLTPANVALGSGRRVAVGTRVSVGTGGEAVSVGRGVPDGTATMARGVDVSGVTVVPTAAARFEPDVPTWPCRSV